MTLSDYTINSWKEKVECEEKKMNKERLECAIHYVMALVGGFLGAYALLNHSDIFCSAQTSNMIYIIINIFGRNFSELAVRILALLVYMSGLACTIVIPKYTKIDMHVFSVLLDMAAVLLIGFFPKNINAFVALYPLFFITAIQWNSFKGAQGYVSSSIFSTNNLRQFIMSFMEYICDKDQKHLYKTKFYGGVLFSYHVGVGISYLSYKVFEIRGAWICLFPLMMALTLVYFEDNWLPAKHKISRIYISARRTLDTFRFY